MYCRWLRYVRLIEWEVSHIADQIDRGRSKAGLVIIGKPGLIDVIKRSCTIPAPEAEMLDGLD